MGGNFNTDAKYFDRTKPEINGPYPSDWSISQQKDIDCRLLVEEFQKPAAQLSAAADGRQHWTLLFVQR